MAGRAARPLLRGAGLPGIELLAGAFLVAALAVAGCAEPTATVTASTPAAPLSATAALSARAVEGFERALEPRPFVFPADHGPHPAFALEWWYLTGNLETDDGRRFGYQLTFFRSALAPETESPEAPTPERESAWATRQLYFAHFALTDVAAGRFHAHERWSRGALGLAGARAEPFAVWLEDWEVRSADPSAGTFLLALVARAGGVALELELDDGKPAVRHGEDGLSRKGAEPGNASYYYSKTRLPSAGTVTVGGERVAVSGLSWLDREWSTSVLEEGQVGWDWFSLQLDDGRELMFFRLRRDDGGVDEHSHGTLVERDGSVRHLSRDDVDLQVRARWESPRGAVYPARWRVRIPSAGLQLDVVPYLADQELDLSFRYWEGAVAATGTATGRPVAGSGYVELVGYERVTE